MKKALAWIVVIAFVVFITLALSRKPASAGTLKVGVLLPLTGPVAQTGQPIKDGLELAKAQSGDTGVSFVYEDTQCDTKTGVSAFNKLLSEDKVDAVVGFVCSGEALAVAPLAAQNKVMMISSAASSPALTGISDYFFRVYPSDAKDADLISSYIKDNGFKSVALFSINNDYGQAIRSEIVKNVGSQIGLDESFDYGTKDFKSLLAKAKSSDLIVLVAYPDSTMTFLKQKDDLGLRQKVVGSSATFTADMFKNPVFNSEFMFSSPDMSPAGREAFVSAFKAKYGTDPIFPAEYGYDTFRILEQAIKSSGSYDPGAIKAMLASTTASGATGEIGFDAAHDRTGLSLKLYEINPKLSVQCIAGCSM